MSNMTVLTRNAKHPLKLLTAALCLLTSLTVLAATETDTEAAPASVQQARLYTVEMIVFSYEEQDKNLSEKWPENIQVELPTAYLNLYSAGDLTQELLDFKEAKTESRVQADDTTGETRVVEMPVGPMPLSPQQRVDLANNRLPDLFYLPDDHLKLTPQRNRLERRKNLRILYHQAWKMPVYARENSIPIVIKGGERYDNLYELEGSIRLSVARYLHLDTQLFLREFEANQSNDQTRVPAFNELLSNQNQSAALLQSSNPTPNPSLALLGFRQYRVDSIIPLQQTRRMRSGDLHYIDHPRFGILIQLTPYNADEEPVVLR